MKKNKIMLTRWLDLYFSVDQIYLIRFDRESLHHCLVFDPEGRAPAGVSHMVTQKEQVAALRVSGKESRLFEKRFFLSDAATSDKANVL